LKPQCVCSFFQCSLPWDCREITPLSCVRQMNGTQTIIQVSFRFQQVGRFIPQCGICFAIVTLWLPWSCAEHFCCKYCWKQRLKQTEVGGWENQSSSFRWLWCLLPCQHSSHGCTTHGGTRKTHSGTLRMPVIFGEWGMRRRTTKPLGSWTALPWTSMKPPQPISSGRRGGSVQPRVIQDPFDKAILPLTGYATLWYNSSFISEISMAHLIYPLFSNYLGGWQHVWTPFY